MILILGKIGFAFALFFLGASMYDVRKILGFVDSLENVYQNLVTLNQID